MMSSAAKSVGMRCLPALYLLCVIVPLLNVYGLWFDEIFSVTMSRNISSIVSMVRTQENNMVLHYLLLWLWMPLGDGGEVFLRWSSVLLVLLSLIPLYAAAQRLSDSVTANTTCLLYVSHFLVLQHVQACRGYTLTLLATSLVFWSWARAWQTGKQGHWLWVGVLAGLSAWTHYFSVLVVPVLLCSMLMRAGFSQPWKKIFIAAIAFIVVALPIVLTRPPDGAAQIGWADVPDARTIFGTLWLLGGADGLHEQPVLAAMLLLVAVTLLWRRKRWLVTHAWRNFVVGLAAGLLVVVAVVLVESFWWQPLFVYRFFTPLVPVYCFVLAAGLSVLWPWLRVVLIVLTLSVSAWETWKPVYTEPVPVRYWWKPMVQKLVVDIQPDDVLLVYPAFLRMPVDYYLDRLDPEKKLPRPVEYSSGYYRQGGGMEPEPDWQRVQYIAEHTSGRVWLITDEKKISSWSRLNRIHAPAIRELLLKNRQEKFVKRYATMSVEGFDKSAAFAD
ncbi:MAG TPA: glycosyltransferase family 39 protein [Pseudomonadales bacterium]|nr:glycosyltransferase family 39 protein [Pseudomonadales bacterium]